MKRKKSKITLEHDDNGLTAAEDGRLYDWGMDSVRGKNGRFLMDFKHEALDNLERAAGQTQPKKMKERLMAYLKANNGKGEYISGFEYALIMIMCGYDYEKASFVQQVDQ